MNARSHARGIALASCCSIAASNGLGQTPFTLLPACLHDRSERPSDRERRRQAIAFATALHAAQGKAAGWSRQYHPLSELVGLPPVPTGFELRLHLSPDRTRYVVSLKDVRDPCRYGLFFEEDGMIYEATPGVPQVAALRLLPELRR